MFFRYSISSGKIFADRCSCLIMTIYQIAPAVLFKFSNNIRITFPLWSLNIWQRVAHAMAFLSLYSKVRRKSVKPALFYNQTWSDELR